MGRNDVGITFRVNNQMASGASSVLKDVGRLSTAVGSVAKFTAMASGVHYSLKAAARLVGGFFSDAVAGSKDASNQAAALKSTWDQLRQSMGQRFIPTITQDLWLLNDVLKQTASASSGVGLLFDYADWAKSRITGDRVAQWAEHTAQERYKIAHPEDPLAFTQTMKGMGWGAHLETVQPKHLDEYNQLLARIKRENSDFLPQVQSTGNQAIAKETAAAVEEVTRLNDALDKQFYVQSELNEGRKRASELLEYATALERAYGGDLQKQQTLYSRYADGLATVDKLRAKMAADQYVQKLRDENEQLSLSTSGNDVEAQSLKAVQDLKRQGIDLTDQQRSRIVNLIDANVKLKESAEAAAKEQSDRETVAK